MSTTKATERDDPAAGAIRAVRAEAGRAFVREIADLIAREAPSLEDITHEQLEALARAVVAERLKDDLRGRADLARIDYAEERKTFLSNAGRSGSANTARAYASALARLDAFAAYRGISVPAMKARDADDFAYSLVAEGRAPASVRRDIAAAASLFGFLERRFDVIRNPFRGTKARPEKKGTRPARVPTHQELVVILAALSPVPRAAAAVMAYRGLRVGALPSLTIRDGRFTARSKGRNITGDLPEKAAAAILDAGLDAKKPFADLTASRIADQFRYATEKLAKAGKLTTPFSVHDLRHYFAVTEYRRTNDLLRVKAQLAHASVQVTETYLRSIGEL